MAVREALLGILTLGPAYGLQLHAELGARAPHRSKTNVGQVYGTLDRLSTAGLVIHHGLTEDGLPLYALTDSGRTEAKAWLEGASLTSVPEWADIQDVVLISSSVGQQAAEKLLQTLHGLLQQRMSKDAVTPAQRLSEQANQRYLESVTTWLNDVSEMNIPVEPSYALGRPKRGRPAKK